MCSGVLQVRAKKFSSVHVTGNAVWTTGLDSCEAHNRALRALGVSEESYSTIVVPTIMEKQPEEFRLAITRGANFLEWSMNEMLEAYEKELELREAFKGHRASNCSVKAKCKNCNGSHHIALCKASLKDDKTQAEKKTETDNESKQVNTNVHVTSPNSNLHVGTGSQVALQTARGVLKGHREVKVRVLFDWGSHRFFVTSKAASLASPKGLRRELLGINTFGQKCTNPEQREVVELNLESVNGKKSLTLEAVVVPEICRVQNAHVELARKEGLLWDLKSP